MTEAIYASQDAGPAPSSADVGAGEMISILLKNWKLVIGAPLLASVLALGLSYLVRPTFSARTTILPPQQSQSGAASALASLGALAGLGGGIKSTGDQYVALLQSNTIADRMVDRFELLKIYEEDLRTDARSKLGRNTRVSFGKKDGIIVIETDDHEPQRATALANAYVDELRKLTARLALTEAQQRRVFFEGQLQQVKDKLAKAQQALQSTGFTAGAIKAEPKATAEGFARLKADATAASVRLQMLRRSLADGSSEVQQAAAAVAALQSELTRLAQAEEPDSQTGYISAYREFKYQETLFDLLARQYELAKVDESRDGGQFQIVDEAQVPERKTKPKRSMFMLGAFGVTFVFVCGWLIVRRLAPSATPRQPG